MATDTKIAWAPNQMRGTPFCEFVQSDDASGNGVEVIAAVTDSIPYVLGYMVEAVTACTVHLAHTAAAEGKTQITPEEHIGDNTTMPVRSFGCSVAGADSKNIGIVASKASAVDILIWGYHQPAA